ncbi:hypothetical protein DM02DRAFT_186103 [Periconia macrospinosa]|uniref:Uncharacterized protein n=1 Tax=Periconia macrospinosa TaxID=97972 RepID=A0A2V1D955_9PLEO|nr:hypothetical protein DM02DRAFT_186103 [Periconia macrospinosa]
MGRIHTFKRRKAAAYATRTRRWINIPKETYPFSELPLPPKKHDSSTIANRPQLLPWPIETGPPCRAWHPDHLWEIGALRKAIFNELSGIDDHKESLDQTEVCLEHILRCWDTNLRRKDSEGPSFLIHLIKSKLDKNLNLEHLELGDAKQIEALGKACDRRRNFQIFLGRFCREAESVLKTVEIVPNQSVQAMQIHKSKCWLERIVHANGRLAKLVPRISEEDLLNQYHFEDDTPDTRTTDGQFMTERWTRAVTIIVPNRFMDNFFVYKDVPLPDTEEKAGEEDELLPFYSESEAEDDDDDEEVKVEPEERPEISGPIPDRSKA